MPADVRAGAPEARDIGEQQTALNEAAGKISLLWTSFVIFQLYLGISFGTVTHRDLLVQSPLSLPILNIQLPLIGFFAIAPALLVVFHAYIYLLLSSFSGKAVGYNAILADLYPKDDDREIIRQRVDMCLFAQILSGPHAQRVGLIGISLKLIAYLSLVVAPITILIFVQLTFLPYHSEFVTWVHRLCIVAAIMINLSFWGRSVGIKADDGLSFFFFGRNCSRNAFSTFVALLIMWFSIVIARFPGETVGEALSLVSLHQGHSGTEREAPQPEESAFGETTFGIDVAGRSHLLFNNSLVLVDENFSRLGGDAASASLSLRGRNLREAIFLRSDFRGVDFTGANLNGASLHGANFSGAKLGCTNGFSNGDREHCTSLKSANLFRANLTAANLSGAELSGANLWGTDLSGASLGRAVLDNANFACSILVGASLVKVHATGADFRNSRLVDADASYSDLRWSNFEGAEETRLELRGAQIGGIVKGTMDAHSERVTCPTPSPSPPAKWPPSHPASHRRTSARARPACPRCS